MFLLPFALLLLQAAPAADTPQAAEPQAAPQGQVLFERHTNPNPPEDAPVTPSLKSRTPHAAAEPAAIDVNDALRRSFTLAGYDLDLHLNLNTGTTTVHARVTAKNTGTAPQTRLPLQISSSLTWQSARQRTAQSSTPVAFEQHAIQTDADHTGSATEAVLTLAAPLAPGAQVDLDLFYDGALVENADRLARLGAPPEQASAADWDGFNASANVSGVRGFGNVLWYPIASPQLFLGSGNTLFTAIADDRRAWIDQPFHLRLTVESGGTRPVAAFFCGSEQPFTTLGNEAPAAPAVSSSQSPDAVAPASDVLPVSTAEWHIARVGLRTPSLFLSTAAVTEAQDANLRIVTAQPDAPNLIARYRASALDVLPLITAWLGPEPLRPLLLLDLGNRPAMPYQDGAMVVLPLGTGDGGRLTASMTEWLTHAWVHDDEAWMTDGLAAFMQGLSTERTARTAGARVHIVDEDGLRALALYEGTANLPPLTRCADPICYRTKGASVWRMLRDITGDDALQRALQLFREAPASSEPASTFESILEDTSGKDLKWFFGSWVLNDRGLPDLSVLGATSRPLARGSSTAGAGAAAATPAGEQARAHGGWLTAVDVANAGDAAAEVPVTVRSADISTTERLLIPAHGHASVRLLTPLAPDGATVNDGSVPEIGSSTHESSVEKLAAPESTPR